MPHLCLNCVRSDALKKHIVEHGEPVEMCTVCSAADTKRIACDAAVFKSKFRALIRYFYSETDYNTHLGGEGLEHLLFGENQITNCSPNWNASEYEDALLEILEPAYEDFDKGISLYAGYTDGEQNMHLIALRRDYHEGLRGIRLAASRLNHFLLDAPLRALIEPLIGRGARIEHAGLALYRARIGYRARAFPFIGWMEERHYGPYETSKLGAPPPPLAGAGRMNRSGVSLLYAATDAATAVAEIRPHPGHYCSVGKFIAQGELKVADLSALQVTDFASSDKELEDFLLLRTIDDAFSIPVTPEERSEYHFPQLLADAFRHLGFDGVCYRSSVGLGTNYAFFNPGAFAYEPGSASVVRIDALAYSTSPMQLMGADDQYMTRADGTFV
jgi:hypothetical protein